MERFFHKHSLFLALALFVVSVLIFANQVLAFGKPSGVGANHESGTTDSHTSQNSQFHEQETNASGSSLPSEETRPSSVSSSSASHMPGYSKEHLQGGKLESCQNVEKTVITRSTHLVDLVTHMEKTFTSIAQGVEEYYLTNVIPTGTTLSTYDALVADITTKQNALTPLVTAAQTDVTNFSCTGNNPGALMTQYRTDMQEVINGLKDYRTSVKNLIVAVRTLPSISPSTTPSLTPTVTATATPALTVAPTATPTP